MGPTVPSTLPSSQICPTQKPSCCCGVIPDASMTCNLRHGPDRSCWLCGFCHAHRREPAVGLDRDGTSMISFKLGGIKAWTPICLRHDARMPLTSETAFDRPRKDETRPKRKEEHQSRPFQIPVWPKRRAFWTGGPGAKTSGPVIPNLRRYDWRCRDSEFKKAILDLFKP